MTDRDEWLQLCLQREGEPPERFDDLSKLTGGLIRTPKEFSDAVWLLQFDDELTVDTETTGLETWQDDYIVGVAVKGPMAGSFYFPFRHEPGGNLPEVLLTELNVQLRSKPTVWFNAPFDLRMFYRENCPFPHRPVQDVRLAAHLHNENEYVRDRHGNVRFRSDGKPLTTFALKRLAERKLGIPPNAQDQLLNLIRSRFRCGKEPMRFLWKLHPAEVAPYAIEDVEITYKLREYYRPLLEAEDLWDLFLEVSEYAVVTTRMECRGLPISEEVLDVCSKEAQEKCLQLECEMSEKYSGGKTDLFGSPMLDFNAISSVQVCRLLGISSSTKDAMEDLLKQLPPESEKAWWVRKIMEYRRWKKAEGSFYSVYKKKIGYDGRLHPNYDLAGTVAGRPSCSNPNLTAVARRTEEYKVKDVFVAGPGKMLLSMDYSQAEVRWGSKYAVAKRMIAVLMSGESIHKATEKDIPGADYDLAKRLNFGGIYGIGPKKFAENAHIDFESARVFLQRFRHTHPEFGILYSQAEGKAEARGYIIMWTGRRRRYDPEGSPAHKASSNLIQGGVAEMLRLAMLRIQRWIDGNGLSLNIGMVLQVHDQILFEIDEDLVETHGPQLQRIMETVVDIGIPLPVEPKAGKSWGSLEPIVF